MVRNASRKIRSSVTVDYARPQPPVNGGIPLIEDSEVQRALRLFAAAAVAEDHARRNVPGDDLGDYNPGEQKGAQGARVAHAWQSGFYSMLATDHLSACLDAAASKYALRQLFDMGIGPAEEDLHPLSSTVLM